MENILNNFNFKSLKNEWTKSKPFNHIILDDFLLPNVIEKVVDEFPAFNEDAWYQYDNAIEIKKAMNSWDRFGPTTYKLFWYLNSDTFISQLENLVCCKLYPDFGLNGGGLHTHRSGGKLNTHLDYSIHPKLQLERRINLLIYVTPNWQAEWGGELGLWDHDNETNKAGSRIETIFPKYNRAVLFDTTQNSWHGLPDPIRCPSEITRNSLAVYYLCEPRDGAENRGRALFLPHGNQQNNSEVQELIKKRSQIISSDSVYRSKK